MIRDYKEGAKVKITIYTFHHILNSYKSTGYPNLKFCNLVKSLIDKEGTVTKRFKPGYEFNVEWPIPYKREDGTMQDVTILQMKDHWVEPLDKNYEIVEGTTYDF